MRIPQWPWSTSSTQPQQNKEDDKNIQITTEKPPTPRNGLLAQAKHNYTLTKNRVRSQVENLAVAHALLSLPPSTLLLLTFTAGSVSGLCASSVYRRYFWRLKNGDWVTPGVMSPSVSTSSSSSRFSFRRPRWVKGVVTNVGDADNFRLYHTPGIGWGWLRKIPSTPKALKDQTLSIRIAGVDAPETSHFGRPAQPYAQEALEYLQSRISGKTVYCQLLKRDQYGRIVSIVKVPPRFLPASIFSGKNLALELLREGWGRTYEQAGAEYGPKGKEEFLRVEAQANAARRGQWAGGLNHESPAEYKRRYATESGGTNGQSGPAVSRGSESKSNSTTGKGSGWFSGWL